MSKKELTINQLRELNTAERAVANARKSSIQAAINAAQTKLNALFNKYESEGYRVLRLSRNERTGSRNFSEVFENSNNNNNNATSKGGKRKLKKYTRKTRKNKKTRKNNKPNRN